VLISIHLLTLLLVGLLWADSTPLSLGLRQIIQSPDVLINDYLETGGPRATFINAALVGAIGFALLLFTRTPITGPEIAAVFTMTGFSFFGKNVLNVLPIILGVYLYSRYRRENFQHFILIALFGTSLAPLVSQFAYGYGYGLPVGIAAGVAAGLIIPGLVTHLIHNHQGLLLYNVGFAAGIVGTLITSQLRAYGVAGDQALIWSTAYHLPLVYLFGAYFVAFLVAGLLLDKGSWRRMAELVRYPGALVTDFVVIMGLPVTLVNMSLVSLIGLAYVLLVGGTLNGPTLGAIFTMLGFAAFGKHPKNIIPPMAGVFMGTLLKIWQPMEPGPLLAGLFVTGVAPLSGFYGPLVGVVAGYLHLAMVMHVGSLHGGLNLYNNGFSGGIVATIIVAVARGFSRRQE
jgi:hypothetical protein